MAMTDPLQALVRLGVEGRPRHLSRNGGLVTSLAAMEGCSRGFPASALQCKF